MADAPKVKAVPKGYRSVTPYLVIKGAAQAIEYYKKAFNAKEIMRMPMPDGRLAHAEIKIGNSIVMLGDENLEQGVRSPASLGGSGVAVFLYVRNVDRTFKRAVRAGATAKMEPTDMFWGDRYGKLTDPFGHEWGLATHKEDVPPEEMAARAQKFMSQGGS